MWIYVCLRPFKAWDLPEPKTICLMLSVMLLGGWKRCLFHKNHHPVQHKDQSSLMASMFDGMVTWHSSSRHFSDWTEITLLLVKPYFSVYHTPWHLPPLSSCRPARAFRIPHAGRHEPRDSRSRIQYGATSVMVPYLLLLGTSIVLLQSPMR